MSEQVALLEPDKLLDGVRLVVIGGTGFLGKIFWVMLLARYPKVGKIYLVVRGKKTQTSEHRFWTSVATNECLRPLREQHGDNFEQFLRDKVVPIDGDVSRPLCGLDPQLVGSLKGTIDVLVNVAGVVDFNPPLDEAIDANAFGARNLISLARALGDTPIYHTSTCYVAGVKAGLVREVHPCDSPFPRHEELGKDAWDPDREVNECLEIIAQARKRCDDAFRQSEFAEKAKDQLQRKGEPLHGRIFDEELANVRRKFLAGKLIEAGLDRASHWGWPNIYTYTKSIGEQLIAKSGLPFTIVRPACSESCSRFPFPGWNEGINTSAPLIFFGIKGVFQLPGTEVSIDFIPADMVCAGMILSLLELLEGNAKPVYQYGTSDTNPLIVRRLGELVGLYKRRYYRHRKEGSPLINFIHSYYEPLPSTEESFMTFGPPGIAEAMKFVGNFVHKSTQFLPGASPVLKPLAKEIDSTASAIERVGDIMAIFTPFSTKQIGPFSTTNTRAAHGRLGPADKEKLWWDTFSIDWADWMMDIHMPGLEKWVLPEMDKKMRREPRALRPHTTLVSLLEEAAERFEHQPALGRLEEEGFAKITYLQWLGQSKAVAARLAAAGVKPKDRVILQAKNHPDWPIAYFGVLMAGCVAVPVDANLEAGPFNNIAQQSRATAMIVEDPSTHPSAGGSIKTFAIHDVGSLGDDLVTPTVELAPNDVASIIYTSGTTGTPKGVMLSHANFTALLGSITSSFPLTYRDRLLSVLPLHHTFEFTCGMLLPLSRGSRIYYLDEINGERLVKGLRTGRITAMVGVPALWQLLERRIRSEAKDKGPVAEALLNFGTKLNRNLGKATGWDLGKFLFGPVHQALGGNLKYLISGGAALPKETQELFVSLGLPLTEGYGLTEAAPVLTVSAPSPKARLGNVGKALPGIELKILDADKDGVGEVLARGKNVMLGYADNEQATSEVLDKDGWLHTGDLGKLDSSGRLTIVGRSKDVVVTANGENVYPDDVERALGKIEGITELALVGVPAPKGGERLACLAVVDDNAEGEGREKLQRAQRALQDAFKRLPAHNQPSVMHLVHAALPRTATRKVKRAEVKAILETLIAAAAPVSGGAESAVAATIAAVANKPRTEVHTTSSLAGDLGYDSLMMVELHSALESRFGAIETAALQACSTVADVEALLQKNPSKTAGKSSDHHSKIHSQSQSDSEKETTKLPWFVQQAGKSLLGWGQRTFYEQVMKPVIKGQAYIPHNRNTLVVANHCSHLDMGFVKTALGTYGESLVSLAAQDYFFERGELQRMYVENFTNLRALDRKGGLRQSLRQAGEILDGGETVLIFPEGTRSEDGALREFKPMIGHLALTHGVDILPICLIGTHTAMPKGSKIPTSRNLEARIGMPLCVSDLRRLTEGMSLNEASREVARLAHLAVRTLRDGGVLDLARISAREEANESLVVHPLVRLFEELEGKFRPSRIDRAISFYFTLGSDEFAKWTVRVDPEKCEIINGKPEGGVADCVLKTTPEIFTRIVRDAYTPGVAEFMSGQVKSNDIELLQTFQKVFALG